MALGITQQIALVPIFLHYSSNDVLATWLAVYAAGNLVLIVDAGLDFRAINGFLHSSPASTAIVVPDNSMPRNCGGCICSAARGDLAVVTLILIHVLAAFRDAGLWRDRAIDLAFGAMIVGTLLDASDQRCSSALSRARPLRARRSTS